MTKRDQIIGKIVDAGIKRGPERPTIDMLLQDDDGLDRGEYLMRLDLPRIVDEDESPKKKNSRMEPEYKR